MDLHVSLLLLSFVCSLLFVQKEVVGDTWKLSKEEDLEVERHLKRLNKPAIKTIHADGDIYDCIDFYKQPAFDNPRLKNHTFDYDPTKMVSDEPKHPEVLEFMKNFGLDGEECPVRTVMIRRVTKKELVRAKIISKLGPDAGNTHYALVRTKESRYKALYAGAGCRFGVYNPITQGSGYSSARMVLQAGYFDRIEVGWRVQPFLTGDEKTHFHIRTDVGVPGSDIHCFYDDCAGFVYTATSHPKRWAFANISQKGSPHYTFQVDIIRDPKTGNWRLRIGPYDGIKLGYWPKEVFSPTNGLSGLADSVEYGGEAYSSVRYYKPPMGIGTLPKKSFSDSSYIAALTYRNDFLKKLDATDLEVFADYKEIYDAIDAGYVGSWYKHVVFYGGPGIPYKK